MKKRLATLMALILAIATLLSACGNAGKNEETTSAGESTTTEQKETKEDVAEDTKPSEASEESEFAEKITLTIAESAPGLTDASYDFTAGNDYLKFFSEKFNIELEVIPLSRDSANEQTTTWINGMDLPDLTVWEFNSVELANYVDQELLLRWPDGWQEKYPNLAKAHNLSSANTYYDELFGGTYVHAVPMYANNFPAKNITNHISICFRNDYLKQANIDISKNQESLLITQDQLTEYMKAVKDAGVVEYPMYLDPNALLTYIEMTSNFNGLSKTNPAFYLSDDGKYHWGPAEDETNVKETIRIIHDQYQAGLIDQDFYQASSGEATNRLFSTGEAAFSVVLSTINNMVSWSKDTEEDLKLNLYDNFTTNVLTDNKGVAHNGASTNYWRGLIINPEIEEKKLDRLLAIMDYLATDEGNIVSSIGLQDIDWKYAEDGSVETLLDVLPNEKYDMMYPYRFLVLCADDFSFINPNNPEEARDLVTKLFITRSDVTNSADLEVDWLINGYTSPAMTQAQLIYVDEYTNLIISSGDFDTNYDNWVNEKMSVIQPVLDELNEGR